MGSPLVLLDISPLPEIIVGGGILIAIGGLLLSLAVFVAGIIRRTRNRNNSKINNK